MVVFKVICGAIFGISSEKSYIEYTYESEVLQGEVFGPELAPETTFKDWVCSEIVKIQPFKLAAEIRKNLKDEILKSKKELLGDGFFSRMYY